MFMESWKAQLLTAELDHEPSIDFGDKDPNELADKGRQMVALYNAQWDPDDEVVSVAEPFCVPLIRNGHPISKPLVGEFDLVVRNNDDISIVDWKTAAKRWPKTKPATDIQSTAYLLAHSMLYSDPAGFRFDVLVGNKSPVMEQYAVERDERDMDRFLAKVELVERIVNEELFVPNDQSFWCAGCPYTAECAQWAGTPVTEAHHAVAV